jgi:hypothetical protein
MRALAILALLLGASHATAQTDTCAPPVAVSVGTGVALAMGSLATGGLLLAGNERTAGRRAGAYTIFTGFALTPVVSHAIAGEWVHASIFGGIGLAVELSAVWLIESTPDLMVEGSLGKRRVLAAFYGLSLLNAGIGLFDSLGAAERAKQRTAFTVAPRLGRGEIGVGIGGSL